MTALKRLVIPADLTLPAIVHAIRLLVLLICMQSVEDAHVSLPVCTHCFKVTYFLDLRSYVLDSEHRCGYAEKCDDDVEHYCKQALTGPRAGVWGIGVAGRCLSKTLAQGQYMAQGCKSLVIAAAPKVCWRVSCMASVMATSSVLLVQLKAAAVICSCTIYKQHMSER